MATIYKVIEDVTSYGKRKHRDVKEFFAKENDLIAYCKKLEPESYRFIQNGAVLLLTVLDDDNFLWEVEIKKAGQKQYARA